MGVCQEFWHADPTHGRIAAEGLKGKVGLRVLLAIDEDDSDSLSKRAKIQRGRSLAARNAREIAPRFS